MRECGDLELAYKVIAGFDKFYANSVAALAEANEIITKQRKAIISYKEELWEESMGRDI